MRSSSRTRRSISRWLLASVRGGDLAGVALVELRLPGWALRRRVGDDDRDPRQDQGTGGSNGARPAQPDREQHDRGDETDDPQTHGQQIAALPLPSLVAWALRCCGDE